MRSCRDRQDWKSHCKLKDSRSIVLGVRYLTQVHAVRSSIRPLTALDHHGSNSYESFGELMRQIVDDAPIPEYTPTQDLRFVVYGVMALTISYWAGTLVPSLLICSPAAYLCVIFRREVFAIRADF